jgi:hypothetical protein
MSNKVEIQVVAFGGWKNNLLLRNGEAEALITLDVGPRILRYGPAGGTRNLLGVMEDQLGKSGENSWTIRGGHRLWTSPEDPARTYAIDNTSVKHAIEGERAVVVAPPDPSQLERKMAVSLASTGNHLSIEHTVTNQGTTSQQISVWALTIMPIGGTGLIPLAEKVRHPEGAAHATAEDFGPQFSMSFWSYFSFDDKRWSFRNQMIRVSQHQNVAATKIGLRLTEGWVGYVQDGFLFVKTVPNSKSAVYPDGGCNFECYTDSNVLELETLSPLGNLAPGDSVTHTEHWAFFPVDKGAIENMSDEKFRSEWLQRIRSALA